MFTVLPGVSYSIFLKRHKYAFVHVGNSSVPLSENWDWLATLLLLCYWPLLSFLL